jgi:hypothetical protein
MTAPNPMMVTLVADRELLNLGDGAVCCSPSAEIPCWVCSAPTGDPYWSAGKPFCCRACFCAWAE